MNLTISTELLEELHRLHPDQIDPVRGFDPSYMLRAELDALRGLLEEWIEAKGWWVNYEQLSKGVYRAVVMGDKIHLAVSPNNYTEAAGWAYVKAMKGKQ